MELTKVFVDANDGFFRIWTNRHMARQKKEIQFQASHALDETAHFFFCQIIMKIDEDEKIYPIDIGDPFYLKKEIT